MQYVIKNKNKNDKTVKITLALFYSVLTRDVLFQANFFPRSIHCLGTAVQIELVDLTVVELFQERSFFKEEKFNVFNLFKKKDVDQISH